MIKFLKYTALVTALAFNVEAEEATFPALVPAEGSPDRCSVTGREIMATKVWILEILEEYAGERPHVSQLDKIKRILRKGKEVTLMFRDGTSLKATFPTAMHTWDFMVLLLEDRGNMECIKGVDHE